MRKKKSNLILLFVFILSEVSFGHNDIKNIYLELIEEETLWINRFEVSNSTNIFPSKTIAEILKNRNFNHCIDLRTTGSSTSYYSYEPLLRHASVVLLSSKNIERDTEDQIKRTLCRESLGTCSATLSTQSFPISQIILSVQGLGYNDSFTRALPTILPQFSKACATGRYSDSWNDAAGTDVAKDFLESMQIELSSIRTIGLKTITDEYLFTFGFPKHQEY